MTQRYRAAFATNVATIFTGILLFMTLIVPLISPHRSSKRLALSLDSIAPAGDSFVFFRKRRESALFYTNRKAVILGNPRHLIDYLTDHPGAYVFVSREHLREFPEIGKAGEIVDQEGSDLVIRLKSSAPATGRTHRQ